MYIFRFVSELTNVITIVESRNGINEISKCFSQHTESVRKTCLNALKLLNGIIFSTFEGNVEGRRFQQTTTGFYKILSSIFIVIKNSPYFFKARKRTTPQNKVIT